MATTTKRARATTGRKAAAAKQSVTAKPAVATKRVPSSTKPTGASAARKAPIAKQAPVAKKASAARTLSKPKPYAANNKTTATAAPVAAYLAAIADANRRADCEALVAIMEAATGCPAAMWGAGIVGFDSYHYVYDSGREGDMCVVGFSSRKGDISVYLTADFPGRDALLAKLGRHKMAKACLYLRTLADVDRAVLEKLVAGSVAERRRRHS